MNAWALLPVAALAIAIPLAVRYERRARSRWAWRQLTIATRQASEAFAAFALAVGELRIPVERLHQALAAHRPSRADYHVVVNTTPIWEPRP